MDERPRKMESMVAPDLLSVYSGKKVFVTGHTGFKGSWLITWLHQLGAEIKGYALAPEPENDLYNKIEGDTICQSVMADIRDKARLVKELVDFRPDFVFHLAAQPLVRLSYNIPDYTFEVNAQGTAYVLEALRQLEKPCIAVMITTDKVYHNKELNYPYKETDPLGGYDPYSASKACAELVIDAYRNSFFNSDQYPVHQKSIAVARAGNVIGGGDWAKDRIVPDIARALSAANKIVVRNPASVRPWQHVLEPLFGYLVLAAQQVADPTAFAEAFNMGPYPDDVLTVEELVTKAVAAWGSGEWSAEGSGQQPHEAGLLQLDISKALSRLPWKPKLNAQQAIEWSIGWYKEFYTKGSDARSLIQQQIRDYTTYEQL